ncbi:LacI family DNA-binding transcriptional regulator [Bacillus sp. FJAT-29814]|uniref:LacI family DNA-binding transcriptional regulator n=1 Tax=Bacillus sp. FJAT-29814 TaxID=1729688 RepID=UPI000829D9A7|nr:LacI family DNA-binding transcriptional regulator [Bacillus sp. FJAT-29814]
MTNIKDLAKMAGVSVTTVSRVLNNHPYVKEEKRQSVLKAIEDSNYQPNINAVHLSKGKTFLVGVVLPVSDSPYFAALVTGIASEAFKNQYNLVLIQTNYERNRELAALQMLKQKQIDGLIICSRACDWATIEAYIPYGPIVLCEDPNGKNVSATFIDHYKSFMKALDYLYGKGHRKIGYCIGRRTGTNSKFREQAYRDFLKKCNLPFNPDYVFERCLYLEDGDRVIRSISQMADPPSALLVTSDQVAAGIVTRARQENIFIPDQLALIGFDNQPIAKMMNITTMEVPLIDVGRKLFLQAINEKEITHQEIDVQLIERQTV